MSSSTITCECGKVIEISPQLNQDLLLICDDLAAKLEATKALLRETVEAWERTRVMRFAEGCYPRLLNEWYKRVKEVLG